jgi:hypothetical protein
MTVPPNFRRTASTPEVLVLHRGRLAEGDIERRQGFAVTRPIRTVADIAALGQREFAEQALRDGARRGVITRRQILDLRKRGGHPEWFDRMLEQCGA